MSTCAVRMVHITWHGSPHGLEVEWWIAHNYRNAVALVVRGTDGLWRYLMFAGGFDTAVRSDGYAECLDCKRDAEKAYSEFVGLFVVEDAE